MRKTALWNILTSHSEKHPYGMILCDELSRKKLTVAKQTGEEKVSFKGLPYVKVSDTLYLGSLDGAPFLYDSKRPKDAANDLARFPKTDDLTDFAREISFATDVILKAEFQDGVLKLSENEFPVTVRKISAKWYLIALRGNKSVILLDASRFLVYAFTDGSFIGGYLEV